MQSPCTHSFRQAFPGPGAPPPLDDDNRARLAGQIPILPPLAEQFLQPFERPALGAADGGHDQTVHHSQLQISHATPWLERQERALTIQRDEIYAGQVLKDVAPNHDQGAPAPHGNQLRFVDDFTHRIKMAGYRIWEVPQAVVEHQSRPRGTWLFYYQIRNRWHFIFEELSAAHDRGSDPAAADL